MSWQWHLRSGPMLVSGVIPLYNCFRTFQPCALQALYNPLGHHSFPLFSLSFPSDQILQLMAFTEPCQPFCFEPVALISSIHRILPIRCFQMCSLSSQDSSADKALEVFPTLYGYHTKPFQCRSLPTSTFIFCEHHPAEKPGHY